VIVALIAAVEAGTILFFPRVFATPIFAHVERVPAIGWGAALIVAVAFVAYSYRGVPAVAEQFFNVSPFKLLGLALAVPSSIVEEIFFRKFVMDALAAGGQSIAFQVVVSAASFGLVHAVWGFWSSWRAALGATLATGILGMALAAVYLLSSRVVLPCIVAHFLINLAIEPWLIYGYLMKARRREEPA
jgi:hypothetical protein